MTSSIIKPAVAGMLTGFAILSLLAAAGNLISGGLGEAVIQAFAALGAASLGMRVIR